MAFFRCVIVALLDLSVHTGLAIRSLLAHSTRNSPEARRKFAGSYSIATPL